MKTNDFEVQKKEAECEDCGEPATMTTADGVPLCDADYAEISRMACDEPQWA